MADIKGLNGSASITISAYDEDLVRMGVEEANVMFHVAGGFVVCRVNRDGLRALASKATEIADQLDARQARHAGAA